MNATKCMCSQFAYITITYCCYVVRISACFSGRCQVEERYKICIIHLYVSSVGNVVRDNTCKCFVSVVSQNGPEGTATCSG